MAAPVGRPTKMTPDTLTKLNYAFSLGCTDGEACFHADISTTTFYRYCEENPEFRDRKEVLKLNPVFKARKVLLDALDKDDTFTAHKVVERKDGTAKQRVEQSGPEGGPINMKHEWILNVRKAKAPGTDEDGDK
jgi:hypothetical protein